MSIDVLQAFLGWCSIIHIAILLWWFGFFAVAHDLVYRIHSHWAKLTREQFDAIHYAGMMIYKLFVFTFFIIPYIVIRVMR